MIVLSNDIYLFIYLSLIGDLPLKVEFLSQYSTATQNHSRWVLLRDLTQNIHVGIFCVR